MVLQEAGEDKTSVSCQAGPLTPSSPLLASPRSVDSEHSQHRASFLQAYSDSGTEAQTPHRVPYDGGAAISSPFTGSSVPLSGVEPAPVVLPLPITLQAQTVTVKPESTYAIPLTSLPSLPSLSSLPSLPAGLVGDGTGLDTWWTWRVCCAFWSKNCHYASSRILVSFGAKCE